jgi:hypothetical protein
LICSRFVGNIKERNTYKCMDEIGIMERGKFGDQNVDGNRFLWHEVN